MSNGIPPQSNPLIPIAGPLMTLGGICLAILGQRMLGISLLSIAVLVVVLHLLGRYLPSLGTALGIAVYAMRSVVGRFLTDAIDTFKHISGFFGRLILIVVVVAFLAGFSGLTSKVISYFWGNERLALDYL